VAEGFSVDPEALERAGHGAASLMDESGQPRVCDLACEGFVVGQARLTDRLGSFCQRWQVGVKALMQDGHGLARNLLETAVAYRDNEQRCEELLRRVLEGGQARG
jgi:hypothetical protein